MQRKELWALLNVIISYWYISGSHKEIYVVLYAWMRLVLDILFGEFNDHALMISCKLLWFCVSFCLSVCLFVSLSLSFSFSLFLAMFASSLYLSRPHLLPTHSPSLIFKQSFSQKFSLPDVFQPCVHQLFHPFLFTLFHSALSHTLQPILELSLVQSILELYLVQPILELSLAHPVALIFNLSVSYNVSDLYSLRLLSTVTIFSIIHVINLSLPPYYLYFSICLILSYSPSFSFFLNSLSLTLLLIHILYLSLPSLELTFSHCLSPLSFTSSLSLYIYIYLIIYFAESLTYYYNRFLNIVPSWMLIIK